MTALSLPEDTIDEIIDDPTILPSLVSPSSSTSSANSSNSNSNSSATITISPQTALSVLAGYTHGVQSVFVLNAALEALCVAVSVGMIKHKELVRADEAEMRRRAREELEEHVAKKGEGVASEVVELGKFGKV